MPHYQRKRSGVKDLSKPFRVEKGKYVNHEGYVLKTVRADVPGARRVTNNTGVMMEHRFVMQQVLGRPLLKTESVHHINGDRADNRIENLELWVKTQPSGQRASDLLVWAYEIIARYGHLSESTFGRKTA